MSADFWEWSIERYEYDGVASRLLSLQDNLDLNVNIVLWCGWCAENFGDIPELVVRKALDLSAHWSRDVTGALRSARRALKSPPRQADATAAEALREEVRRAELAAEKIEQEMLARLAHDMLPPPSDASNPLARLRRNLVNYASIAGAQRREGFSVTILDDLARRLMPDAAKSEETEK